MTSITPTSVKYSSHQFISFTGAPRQFVQSSSKDFSSGQSKIRTADKCVHCTSVRRLMVNRCRLVAPFTVPTTRLNLSYFSQNVYSQALLTTCQCCNSTGAAWLEERLIFELVFSTSLIALSVRNLQLIPRITWRKRS